MKKFNLVEHKSMSKLKGDILSSFSQVGSDYLLSSKFNLWILIRLDPDQVFCQIQNRFIRSGRNRIKLRNKVFKRNMANLSPPPPR